jgi:anhydro-N-acetylmuramic acid kinase
MANSYKVIGLMSGTSLDGVDLAYCEFILDSKWKFQISHTETTPYPKHWFNILSKIHLGSALDLSEANINYGHYLGNLVKSFVAKHSLNVDFIASHGHTIFHQPEKSLTVQIGDGNAISAQTGLPVVYDFRSKDVALGGQGAPLVTVGDQLLFSNYDFCINLGGIANLSFDKNGKRIAFDICPANQVLNYLSKKLNKKYDDKGKIAARGNLNTDLISFLNDQNYYKKEAPKTLGREWVEEKILPILNSSQISIEDQLRTFTEHIAIQITKVVNQSEGKALLTGGGAHNLFLIERIRALSQSVIVIPSSDIIDYKEAMIFGFLGVLRMRNEVNSLCSVTGACNDSSTGIITA